jgi:hypothetical protein
VTGEARHDELGAAIRQAAEAVHAPATLRATLAEQQERRGRKARRGRRLRLAAAGALAAALAVVVVLATGGAAPTVPDVAASALQPPTSPAPHRTRDHEHIAAEIGGIRFPYWEESWGWRAVGARTDEVQGRRALTVIYTRKGRGVHYTVVDGEPLEVPESARRVTVEGVRAAILRSSGADIVVWERQGRTCILASRMVSADRMAHFIAW